MIEVFFISLKGSSPGQPWMIPSVTSNSLCMKKVECFKESPVEPHLSIEGDLIGAADEPELLAAGFAELALRDVFAAVIILTDVFLQIRKLTFHI